MEKRNGTCGLPYYNEFKSRYNEFESRYNEFKSRYNEFKSRYNTEARRFHFVFPYLWILNFRIFEKKVRFYGKNPFLRKNKSFFT